MSVVLELVFMLLFGWVPERPRWAMWLVIAIYVLVLGAALAFALAQIA